LHCQITMFGRSFIREIFYRLDMGGSWRHETHKFYILPHLISRSYPEILIYHIACLYGSPSHHGQTSCLLDHQILDIYIYIYRSYVEIHDHLFFQCPFPASI
jgi:hypothetical protein